MIYLLILSLAINIYFLVKISKRYLDRDMQLNLLYDRWKQLIYTLPSKREHQSENDDPDLGHRFLSLEQEISQWGKWISHGGYSEKATSFCQKRIDEIKDELKRRGYEPELPHEKLTPAD